MPARSTSCVSVKAFGICRIQRHGQRQVGEVRVRPLHLAQRHFEFLEIEVGDALLEPALHVLVGKNVLLREARDVDRLQPREEALVAGVLALDSRKRIVVEPVVVAIIAIGGRALGIGFEVGLVLLFEERVLGRETFGDGSGFRKCSRADNEAEARSEGENSGVGVHRKLRNLHKRSA